MMGTRHWPEDADEAVENLEKKCAELQADLAEQCRLLSMGSEREARLMAQLAESQAREAKLLDALRNITFADEVRVLLRDMPTDDTALREMIAAAKAEEREAIEQDSMRKKSERAR